MMSVHDALEAWQRGDISTSQAQVLSGAKNIIELYALADACDVDIRMEMDDRETAAVEKVTDAIRRALMRENTGGPPGMKVA